MNLTLIKNLIPIIFAAIIVTFLWSLNSENKKLTSDNNELRAEYRRVNSKNDDLANTLGNLTEKIGQANAIASTEARRRAAAEMKNNKLQEEVKDALKNNKCSVELVPDSVISRLLEQANRIRIGKDADYSDSSKSDK
ncbi:DUF2570 domain-containing protein [Rahnella rivi]|uniref:DUF2570 domain-containing protein n=1 Tax=Rahnella rivi TaxID=2816249 RepID=UPI001C257FFB|nr:DUF2570 domain-containing protein [Rahnella rivi]MBU9829871.1 DUF2570 domain-containing protein [Rahnella rivi]